MKILYQSFGDLGTLPRYRASLERHVAEVAAPTTTVEVRGLKEGSYGAGAVPPIAYTRYPYLKYLNQLQIIDGAIRAEAEGFSAMAIGCFHDPALREARSVVSIPVAGIAESSMFAACSFGYRFGVVTTCTEFEGYTRILAGEYGIDRRMAGVEVLEPGLTEFDLEDLERAGEVLGTAFEASAEALRRAGAEIIIPGDGNLNEALRALDVREVCGLPVLDAVACVLKCAESYAALREATGLETSRAGYYAKPPVQQLTEVRARYGHTLAS